MKRVWIAQCLCGPQRHAIMASFHEAEDQEEAEVLILAPLYAAVDRLLNSDVLAHGCGLCGSPPDQWRYEFGPSIYETMAEAEPLLRETEAANITTGQLFAGIEKQTKQ